MTVLEIFKQVDKNELIDKIMELHPNYYSKNDNYTQNQIYTLDKVNTFFNDIEKIKTLDFEDDEFIEYKDFVIIISKYYDDNNYDNINIFDLNKKDFNINNIDKNKLNKYFIVDGIHLNQLKKNNKVLSYTLNEMKNIKNIFENGIITYGLDFLTRKIVLNLRIAEPSISIYGLSTIAAELFWELTFYGLTEEKIQKKSNELNSKIEEINNQEIEETKEVSFFLEDTTEEILSQEDLDFSMNFSRKVAEYNHILKNEFLKEVYNWVLNEHL